MLSFAHRNQNLAGDGADAWDLHFLAITEATKQPIDTPLNAQILVLSVGDPDQDTPDAIKAQAIAAINANHTHYTPLSGLYPLREAIANHYVVDHYNQTLPQTISAEHIIITAGTQNALYLTAQTLLNPDDEAIVLSPYYVTYPATIGAAGAKLIPLPCPKENGFRPDLSLLPSLINAKSKAIFLANPNNPTGKNLPKSDLAALYEMAKAHDLWLVSDEVYGELVFAEDFIPMAHFDPNLERVITLSSLSKSHAMTGWRAGWAMGNVNFIHHMEKFILAMLYGLPGFIQEGAITALQDKGETAAHMRELYFNRMNLVLDKLQGLKRIKPIASDAGMFILLDIQDMGMTAKDFCAWLYQTQKVSLLDASAFAPSNDANMEGLVRLSLSNDIAILEEACRRIHLLEKG